MEAVFLKIVNMSINASWLIAAVMVLRLLLRNVPKNLRCLMWGVAAIRLVLPFSLESMFSLIPSPQTLPDNILYTAEPIIDSGIPFVDNTVNPILSGSMAPSPMTSANPTQIWSFIFSQLWILGMVLMLGYALFSWLHVRSKVSASIAVSKDVRLCDYIDSPFILGIFRPVIYIPSALEPDSTTYVMAHERSHLKRRDHWWKPLGFAVLTVHWFNPLVWIAYVLLCRDIELSCDERVIRDLGTEEKQAYSNALLSCSIRRPYIAACPLAFGEVGVKQRIQSVLHYKKPAFWILLLSVIACIVAGVCFFTEPVTGEHTLKGTTITYKTDENGRITFITHSEEDTIYTIECKEKYPTGAVERPYRLFPNGEIRDAAGNLLHIQHISITGLRRETVTRLIDHYQYDPQTETFTLSPGSDSLDQLTLCSFPDIPKNNNLAAFAGFGDREICGISLSSRVGVIGLESRQAMEEFVDFLSGYEYDPVPLSQIPVSEDTFWAGSVRAVAPENRNCAYLEDMLLFSEDFSTVWIWSEDGRGLPYAVRNPEGLADYFTRRTIPAKNASVTAAPFATAEEPGKWLKNIHAGALEKVITYYQTNRVSAVGYMTTEHLNMLLPLLNSIPESALSPNTDPVFFTGSEYEQGAFTLEFYDRANGILVKLHLDQDRVLIVTYPNIPEDSGYRSGDAKFWLIDFPELTALMMEYRIDHPRISPFASREDYIERYPGTYIFGNSLGAQSVTITLPEGWILDSYREETSETGDTLFRLWPAAVDSGSITVQYRLKDTFSVCGTGCTEQQVMVGFYPATALSFGNPPHWRYLIIPGRTCDLVIENEADDWFSDYESEITSILATLYTEECMVTESEMHTIAMSLPGRPKYTTVKPVLNEDGTWTVNYYDLKGNLTKQITTDLWGNPL